MFELALKAIEEKIKSETNSRDFYEKEIAKYQGYHTDQILKIENLKNEYDALRKKLGLDKETV